MELEIHCDNLENLIEPNKVVCVLSFPFRKFTISLSGQETWCALMTYGVSNPLFHPEGTPTTTFSLFLFLLVLTLSASQTVSNLKSDLRPLLNLHSDPTDIINSSQHSDFSDQFPELMTTASGGNFYLQSTVTED